MSGLIVDGGEKRPWGGRVYHRGVEWGEAEDCRAEEIGGAYFRREDLATPIILQTLIAKWVKRMRGFPF